MQIEELMERIKLPPAAREQVKRQVIADKEYTEWKEIFYRDTKHFLEKWKEHPDKLTWALELFVRLSTEVYETYQEKQIPDKVFDQTFYDLTLWCEECYRKYDVYGLEEVGWLSLSVKMNMFRLGRLQFEPMVLEEDMVGENQTIKAGTHVLNVHVPAGEPLCYEACLDSFRQAEAFFDKENQIYICDSWLLSPNLKEVLPEECNIIRFQNLFEVTKVHYTFRQAEQRIFGEISADKNKYPEDTKLQKNAKAYVVSGKVLGIGTGFIEDINKICGIERGSEMRETREVAYEMKLLSSLAKVFQDEEPVYQPECLLLSGLWGETISFQTAYTGTSAARERLDVRVVSPIEKYVRIRTVEQVPVRRAVNAKIDDYYLKTTPGMYPDLLRDLKDGKAIVCTNQWRSLWIDVEITEEIPAGNYDIEIQLVKEGKVVCSSVMKITIIGVELPKQKIMHTEWLHADCLADYYKVDVFSEEHWEILENYFHEYVKRGGNMMIAPLFTSPLDTAIGYERTTTQLIDVEVNDGEYIFGFDRMKRWIDLCKSCGIEYFEMSHLFSQWGARYAPKVVAMVDGNEEKIFGWHTPAVGEYTKFLEAFLPKLIEKLREWEIADVTYFHISDEPREEDLEAYRKAKESLGNMLDGFHTFDALSSYEFYRHGLVDKPIPGNNEIEEFIEHGLTDLWTYYCTLQHYEVSNRFMSMPSARNRIYGVQLYKYDIIGILHWGYNFYNSQFSMEHINPYEVTDACDAFPAGDPFLVYPGADRHPEESIRMMVHYEALTDLRALKLLESLTSKEHVMELIEGDLAEPLTFRRYPKSDMYIITLRNRVNREIARLMTK